MRVSLLMMLFFLAAPTFAQVSMDQKMSWYAKAKPSTKLFVHFDKNVYANNEQVWFTGYLLRDEAAKISAHRIMALALVRDADSALILTDKFLMQNGLSFGSIKLPDSLLTGNYHLISYTDRLQNGQPKAIFKQAITIKTNIEPAFKASMKLNEPLSASEKNHTVLVSVTTTDGRFLPKATKISYRYGKVNQTAQTDISGQLLLMLPKQELLTDPNLYAKLSYQKDSSFVSMALPQSKSRASVKFYPEGGNLVDNLYSTIGWEVKDQQRMPIPLKAFLYKNGSPIDTIETSSYGMGKFLLYPEKGANYSVKLLHDGLIDSTYYLPKTIPDGIAFNLNEAVVQDTLRLKIRTRTARTIYIRLHNFKETFLSAPFKMEVNTSAIKIPMDNVPKGLVQLTVTDSLNRPLAERLVFAHYDKEPSIKLSTDRQTYQQRSEVKLSLDPITDQLPAVISIAVVQDNRLEIQKMNDIKSYTYLTSELGNLPVHVNGIAYNDKAYLEQLLLIKGWRRYTWQDLQSVKPSDTVAKSDSLKVVGIALKNNKKISRPVTIATFGGTNLTIMDTDSLGGFHLSDQQLIVAPEKKLYAFINGAGKLTHTLNINDGFQQTSLSLAKIADNEAPTLPSKLLNNTALVLKSNEKEIRLKEVVIKSRTDNSFNFASGANECGDYVCAYNILNCRNHSSGTPPIAGKTYSVNGHMEIYSGCAKQDISGFFQVNPVHVHKEFYINDYKEPLEPAFVSTLYWNYGILLNDKKPVQLSFHTSDITGRFRVVVQGVANGDVIYAEQFFEVKGQ
jgi:hypothetical protein